MVRTTSRALLLSAAAAASLTAVSAQPSTRTFNLLTASVADIQAAVDHGALTYAMPAPPLGTADRGPRDNPLSSLTGLPAIVVPAGVNAEGLPIAIEFLGRPFGEPTLIRLAHAYERASRRRVPPPSTPNLPGEVFEY